MKKIFITISVLCLTIFVLSCSKDENKILETAVPLGGDGCFYYLPDDVIEENLTQEILSFQEQLLSYCFVYDEEADADILHLRLLSMDSGKFLSAGSLKETGGMLNGRLLWKQSAGGYLPTAFVQHENGKITMVLNVCSDAELLERTFYHETSHIIDQVLAHDAQYREDALYSEEKWQSLNPDKFTQLNPENGGYYGSYEMLPMSYYDESFVPYFASDYGKSFPTEDRATIFEGAMAGSLQKSLREKLEYYCECIRDCFDTSGWPNSTTWEETLKAY